MKSRKKPSLLWKEKIETMCDLENSLSEAKSAITTLAESHKKEVEDLQAEIAKEKQRSPGSIGVKLC